ncbi:MAG TPA: hypothetical protein VH724_05600 [Candidatus Angelobacter sp.]|nr:hypothetical protein [Candidatus Angelobacter sp.]
MSCSPENFATGDSVPTSGIYSVQHSVHHLFAEVALFKGEVFPKCARCSDTVIFQMVREFLGLDAGGLPSYRTPLYELAVLDADSESVSAA